MYKFLLLAALLFALAACSNTTAEPPYEPTPAPPSRELPAQVDMFFIYEESCATCDGTEEFFALVGERLSDILDLHPTQIHTINTFHRGNTELFQDLAYDLLNVNANTLSKPVLIVNGLAFQGMAAIGGNMREALLTAGHDLFVNRYVFNPRYALTGDELFANTPANPQNLTLLYFYRMVCPACIEIEPLMQAIPQFVTIDGRQVQVDVIRFNTRSGNNRDRVMAAFDHFNVPDEMRSVPIIITASGHYTGAEAITEMLETLGQSDQIGLQLP